MNENPYKSPEYLEPPRSSTPRATWKKTALWFAVVVPFVLIPIGLELGTLHSWVMRYVGAGIGGCVAGLISSWARRRLNRERVAASSSPSPPDRV